jgi:hypothetical protein
LIDSKQLLLLSQLLEVFPEERLCYKDTEIEVSGALAKTRLPDLMVLSEAFAVILGDGRGTITRDMLPAILILAKGCSSPRTVGIVGTSESAKRASNSQYGNLAGIRRDI